MPLPEQPLAEPTEDISPAADKAESYPAAAGDAGNTRHDSYKSASDMANTPGSYYRKASVAEVFSDYDKAAQGNVPTVFANAKPLDPRKPARSVTAVLDDRIADMSDRLEQLKALRAKLATVDITMADLNRALER